MRVIINPAAGYLALPFIVLVGAAYIWVVSKFVGQKDVRHEEPSDVRKAA
jgi:hypothetical protein